MKVFLNGTKIEKKLIGVNDGLNFGRFSDKGVEDYTIQLSTSKFLDLQEKEYVSVRDQIKEDDERYQDGSDFQSVDYCSLPQLLKDELALEEILKTYFDHILLNKLFDWRPSKKYIINSLDSVRIEDGKILIEGKFFQAN
ncbi:hypothetical protein [Gramella sp. KN1008]|uniref:hypothetical protein n=1 Tax=Gramella sp. KN1008 TaxID=2529298 RepID=UPI00103A6E05|nr:hypothetical protein [Gramella sp. KN1008]TBW29977.1 hypothetical protein EZJ28_00805 [Gramella sp. KN1008]